MACNLCISYREYLHLEKDTKRKVYQFIDGAFFQEKLPLLYLGCALGVILAMAFISGLDVHPDEMGHANSSSYYSDSWLLPSVDDPKVLKTISGLVSAICFGRKSSICFPVSLLCFYQDLSMTII